MRTIGWVLFGVCAVIGFPAVGLAEALLTPPPVRKIICPVCAQTGKNSTVRQWNPKPAWNSGWVLTTNTSVYQEPAQYADGEFYDEDGRQHVHNESDERIHRYTCSNKHEFKISPSLCWCGWGEEPRTAPTPSPR